MPVRQVIQSVDIGRGMMAYQLDRNQRTSKFDGNAGWPVLVKQEQGYGAQAGPYGWFVGVRCHDQSVLAAATDNG